MNRRHLLKSLVATTLASAFPTIGMYQSAFATEKKYPWKNWSGNQQCYPSTRLAPGNINELQSLIRATSNRIRAVGAGHSFSPLVPTEDTLLSIRRLSGLKQVDTQNRTATLFSGTLLSEVGPILAENDQALFNMPDIDQQTLSGAICTATHGTGRTLGSLSSYVESLELITASGELVFCSETVNHDLFKAAQVSLGALGVITSITMKNSEPFKLERKAEWVEFEQITAQAEQLSKTNRNFEFFYFPFTGMALTDTLNITEAHPNKEEEIDGNSGIMDLKSARDYLSWSNTLRELIVGSYLKSVKTHISIDHSYAIYASDRNVRFNEMEYHLPAEQAMTALKEVRSVIESQFPEVFFPIECRFIQSEDAWLSPFYKRETISIAIHRYFEEDYQPMFDAIEPVLQKYNGRPHWGKVNSFSHSQFKDAYPKWQDFQNVRDHYDPKGKFLNPYLKNIFDIS